MLALGLGLVLVNFFTGAPGATIRGVIWGSK